MATGKKAIKKVTITKKKEAPKEEFNFWEASNDIDSLCNKLECVKHIIELAAESNFEATQSGALWAASDLLQVHVETLERIGQRFMDEHRKKPSVNDTWKFFEGN